MKVGKFTCFIIIPSIFSATSANASSPLEGMIDGYLQEQKQTICNKYSSLPKESCFALVEAATKSVVGQEYDKDAVKQKIKNDLNKPEYLNSILLKVFSDDTPISLEFKTLDSEESGETVLGLAYNIDYNFYNPGLDESTDWHIKTSIDFQASGTITNDHDKNPQNFQEAKFSFSRSYTTNIPQQDEEFADKLTTASIDAAPACAGLNAATTEACKKAKKVAYDLLDTTSDFLKAFQRYKFGLETGYETDQAIDAKQSTFGAFLFGQYESWGRNSWTGDLKITPSFRISLDNVDPNEETPRAQLGDDSSYYRFSGEVSLWLPIGSHFGNNLTLTMNYRYYKELDPSDIVEDARMDSYNIRVFSLTSPTGLFVTYSSGRLPFDLVTDDIVELGWKTYF